MEDGIVDGKQANANTVDIGLLVVHASSSGNTIDPKLRSLASHFENYKYTSYKFRIYFFGKRQIIYLGKEEDLKMGFKNNTNFDDFDEYLKDMGRKRFLQRLGKQETNVRQAQRRLSKLHNV